MFNLLTTCYLFLGGAGAGALTVLSLMECANARRRFAFAPGLRTGETDGALARLERAWALPCELFARAWPACLVVLGLGVLCLLADLGRPDRLLNLVSFPRASAVAVGAYALMVSLACAAAFCVMELFDGVRVRAALVWGAGAVGVVAGVVAMAYTGLLLQDLASVLFWQTPLLPAMFVLSSASCGIACVLAAAAFVESRHPFMGAVAWLARVDGAVVAAEALCVTAYLVWGFSSEDTAIAAEALAFGDLAWVFWGGLVVFGLAVPFAFERFITYGNSRTQLLWIAAFLLVGGFALRFVVVEAGAYDVTQMAGALYGLDL